MENPSKNETSQNSQFYIKIQDFPKTKHTLILLIFELNLDIY